MFHQTTCLQIDKITIIIMAVVNKRNVAYSMHDWCWVLSRLTQCTVSFFNTYVIHVIYSHYYDVQCACRAS